MIYFHKEHLRTLKTKSGGVEVLNGAQINSVLSTVQSKKDGLITSEQAKAILTSGLGMTEEQANKIIGAKDD